MGPDVPMIILITAILVLFLVALERLSQVNYADYIIHLHVELTTATTIEIHAVFMVVECVEDQFKMDIHIVLTVRVNVVDQ
jgi:hypothetical protein